MVGVLTISFLKGDSMFRNSKGPWKTTQSLSITPSEFVFGTFIYPEIPLTRTILHRISCTHPVHRSRHTMCAAPLSNLSQMLRRRYPQRSHGRYLHTVIAGRYHVTWKNKHWNSVVTLIPENRLILPGMHGRGHTSRVTHQTLGRSPREPQNSRACLPGV